MTKSASNTIETASESPIDSSHYVLPAKSRIDRLDGILRKVAIVRMWPDQAVAEHENVERFRTAFALMGVSLLEVDRYGIIINSPGQQVTREDVDFVIHLHFETSKTYNVTSVAALWNPTQFYFDWGFDRFWSNQITHDIFAHTNSSEILGLLAATRGEVDRRFMPVLNHSLAAPIIPPRANSRYRAFYCGINWELISGKKGRHDAVLKSLDSLDLVDIYGPRSLQGKPVWEGYKGYKQPLPFDGRTIIEKISEAGTCLVFSSEAHIQSNIMSNRLFEALAAGAVVFGDEHPFIRQAIGNNYILVNSTRPALERAQIVAENLHEFNLNPGKAIALAGAAQQLFLEKFNFCEQLASVYEAAVQHQQITEARISACADPILDIVLQPIINNASLMVDRVRTLYDDLANRGRIHLVVPRHQYDWYEAKLGKLANIVQHDKSQSILNPYECVTLIGDSLSSKKVCFQLGIEDVFVTPLLSACLDLKSSKAGRCAFVLKHTDTNSILHYDGRNGGQSLEQFHEAAIGSVIFDRAWLQSKIPSSSLSWRDICRIAEIEEEGVSEFFGTVLAINLRDYELSHFAGMEWTKPTLDVAEIIKISSQSKTKLGQDALLKRTPPEGSRTEYRNLSGNAIVAELQKLPVEERWRLMLTLYKSTPLPPWIRKTITFLRKAVGVR